MSESVKTGLHDLTRRRSAPLATPVGLVPEAATSIAGALNEILADVFALYIKTKNFHWHMSGDVPPEAGRFRTRDWPLLTFPRKPDGFELEIGRSFGLP